MKPGDFVIVDGKLQVVVDVHDNGYSTRPPTAEEKVQYESKQV